MTPDQTLPRTPSRCAPGFPRSLCPLGAGGRRRWSLVMFPVSTWLSLLLPAATSRFPRSPMRRCSVGLLLLLLGLSAGCVQRSAPPLGQRALVAIDGRGGHCGQGVCTARTLIRADGTVFRDGVRLTTVSQAEVTRLVQLIAATDFVAVRAVRPRGPPPFAGCESAVDGSDVTYRITTRAGVEELDGCTTAIDFHAPLFELIDALVASAPAPPQP